jgi:hypothetical protein
MTIYPPNLRFAFRHPPYPKSLQSEIETYYENEDYAELLHMAEKMCAEGVSQG